MTLPVVQFCFAIARGDKHCVHELLPKMSDHDLFEENDFGVSPALFCFLAASHAKQNRSLVLFNRLCAHFPNESQHYDPSNLHSECVSEASQIAITAIKGKLVAFLNTLLSHTEKPETETQAACTTALNLILEDTGLETAKRDLTQSMLNLFSRLPRAASLLEKEPHTHPKPRSLAVVSKHQSMYLPSLPLQRPATSARCSQLEKRLDRHSHALRYRSGLLST